MHERRNVKILQSFRVFEFQGIINVKTFNYPSWIVEGFFLMMMFGLSYSNDTIESLL